MLLLSLSFILLQIATNAISIMQLANFALFIINTLYTIVITVFIKPVHAEHKLLVEDYKSRNSPHALAAKKELKDRDKKDFEEIIAVIRDLKHSVNELKQDKVNLSIYFDQLDELKQDLHLLTKNIKKNDH